MKYANYEYMQNKAEMKETYERTFYLTLTMKKSCTPVGISTGAVIVLSHSLDIWHKFSTDYSEAVSLYAKHPSCHSICSPPVFLVLLRGVKP